jgi:hypothetical protein
LKDKKLSTSDISEIFLTMDIGKDGTVSHDEYKGFFNAFVHSFEVCDTKNEYVVDDLKTCLPK